MRTLQRDYEKHDSGNLAEGLDAVRRYAEGAILVAWDGCHKIYLAMDKTEAKWFKNHCCNGSKCGYSETFSGSPYEMYERVVEWYEGSCGLRFVSAVWHDEANPNAGFVRLIDQGVE